MTASIGTLLECKESSYFDDINTHNAGDINLGFCRQLTTFAKES